MDYSVRRIASMLLIVLSISFNWFSCREKVDENLPYYNTAAFDPLFIESETELRAKVPHQIADFEFTNQDSTSVTQGDIEGKVHVANFIFTTCNSICPKMTSHMKLVSEAFKEDDKVKLLSFSVTPWLDDVAQLREYAKLNDISSTNWHLLTGSRSKIYELARKSYFAEEGLGFTKDSTQFLHTEHFILVDQSKRIRGIYNGTLQLEIQQLIKDINVLKNPR